MDEVNMAKRFTLLARLRDPTRCCEPTETFGDLCNEAADRLEVFRCAIIEIHRIARSGESDLRAIGPILNRFPELDETPHNGPG